MPQPNRTVVQQFEQIKILPQKQEIWHFEIWKITAAAVTKQ